MQLCINKLRNPIHRPMPLKNKISGIVLAVVPERFCSSREVGRVPFFMLGTMLPPPPQLLKERSREEMAPFLGQPSNNRSRRKGQPKSAAWQKINIYLSSLRNFNRS